MGVWPAGGAAAATASTALHGAGRRRAVLGHARREDGQLLPQLLGPAMGAGRAFPFGRTDQDFAVFTTIAAMKLINRHGGDNIVLVGNLKCNHRTWMWVTMWAWHPNRGESMYGWVPFAPGGRGERVKSSPLQSGPLRMIYVSDLGIGRCYLILVGHGEWKGNWLSCGGCPPLPARGGSL